ncbi:DctP family TRAP transporter solute-binding subunit (plasmid) [Microvirga sp. RSM25]|uniref:DctP family TRAP transporter solute-binding subunit n=1 Tax=Microvirga sp. RSM25 TaxID=3273802 RepID=UPI00384D499E
MKVFTKLTVALIATLPVTSSAYAEFQNRTLRASNTVTEIHPVGAGLKKMSQCLSEKSGGKMKLQPFWGGALGSDGQATQALRAGTLEMVTTATSSLVGIAPKAGVFDLPYLVENEEQAYKLLDGKIGNEINKELEAAGLINLGYWENGFRHVTMSKLPITKWENLSGRKLRVLPSPIHIAIFKAFGATAVPMSFGEVIAALETGAIDGQDNTLVNIDTLKIYEVQKYLSLTGHMYNPLPLLYSKKLFDQLAPEEQQALRECGAQGRDEERRVSQQMARKAVENVKAHGMQVNDVSPTEVARFKEKSKTVYDEVGSSFGEGFMVLVNKEIAALSAAK